MKRALHLLLEATPYSTLIATITGQLLLCNCGLQVGSAEAFCFGRQLWLREAFLAQAHTDTLTEAPQLEYKSTRNRQTAEQLSVTCMHLLRRLQLSHGSHWLTNQVIGTRLGHKALVKCIEGYQEGPWRSRLVRESSSD